MLSILVKLLMISNQSRIPLPSQRGECGCVIGSNQVILSNRTSHNTTVDSDESDDSGESANSEEFNDSAESDDFGFVESGNPVL